MKEDKKSYIHSFSVKAEDREIFEKFTELQWIEKVSVSRLILSACKEYLEHHQGGNPNYSLEKWRDPDFLAVPAFMATEPSWRIFYEKIPKAMYDKLDTRLNWLLRIHNAKLPR